MSTITGIGQVHIGVGDLNRAVSFYRDTVGLEFLFTVPDQQMAFLLCGSVRLYLSVASDPKSLSDPVIYLSTDSIEAEHARLANAGVEFIQPPVLIHHDEATELWMAFFRDTEGRPIGLMEERLRG